MQPELHKALAAIEVRLAHIDTKLERASEDRAALLRLEHRVSQLESFQGKIIGAVMAAGSLGGVIGALIPFLLKLV